jgi:uncharacterized membrane protein
MQIFIGLIIVIGVFYFLINKIPLSFSNMSFNTRVGIFSFLVGIILRIVAVPISISNSGGYSSSPNFLYSVISGLSGLAFLIAICCLIRGLYKMFFYR